MNYKAHAVSSAATGLLVSSILNSNPVLTTASCIIGSLLPDIDYDNSKILKLIIPSGNKDKRIIGIYLLGLLFIVLPSLNIPFLYEFANLYPQIRFVGFLMILSRLVKKIEYRFSLFSGVKRYSYHRTFFHSFWGMTALLYSMYKFNVDISYVVAFGVGYFIHLVLFDLVTPYGCPLFNPFGKPSHAPIVLRSKILRFIYVTVYLFVIIYIQYALYGLPVINSLSKF